MSMKARPFLIECAKLPGVRGESPLVETVSTKYWTRRFRTHCSLLSFLSPVYVDCTELFAPQSTILTSCIVDNTVDHNFSDLVLSIFLILIQYCDDAF